MEQDVYCQPVTTQSPPRNAVISMCGVCPAGCGVTVHLVDGKIDHMTPLPGHPQGIVCPRGTRAKEIVYSPERILYPQKRVGPRGEGRFERISWDEAYDSIVENLHGVAAQYGPEAVATYTGRGNFEFGLNEMYAPAGTIESSANAVLFPFGSPNTTGVGAFCYAAHGMIAPRATFGEYIRSVEEDVDHADLLLIWGANPTTDSSPINLRRVKNAQKRGARVIVIDHRRNETLKALRAEWLAIRPGTDGALALAAIHVLFKEDLIDHEFAETWVHGLAELRDYVREFSPARAEQITGIPAESIVDMARAVARAKGCSILTYTGLEYSNSGVQSIRAVWILQALAGHLDAPGGKLFRMKERFRANRLLTAPPKNARRPIGYDEYPLYYETRVEAHASLLPRAILRDDPYPVRMALVSGTSLITSWPNPALWKQALAALDFLVVVNRFPTADALYADVILPATTMFEVESYMVYDNYVQLRQRVIEPVGEARNDYLIFAELARRLGYGHLWPQTEEAMIRYSLNDTGVTLEQLRAHPQGLPLPAPEFRYKKYRTGDLRPDGKPGFNTPSGKFEVCSEWLKQHHYSPLPVYTEPLEGPPAAPSLAQKYPLVFNSGARTQFAFRSQHHNIPSLTAKQPEPLVHLHALDARARGIVDGDEVYVVSPRGKVPFKARVSEDGIKPGVVEVNMGGGGPLGPKAWQAANVNELTDENNVDPLSGFPVYKALLCNVVKR